jgi:regulator of replication initiation timing
MRLDHETEPLNTLPDDADVPSDLRESIEDTAEKLKTLGEKLRVKLHLAGMEAKDLKSELFDTVDNLSRRLSDYAGSLGKTKESAEVQLHLGLMDVRTRWEAARVEANKALSLFKEDKEKARSFLQDMRVQAQLAKAETSDALQDTKAELSDNFKEISRQGASALKRMNKSVGEFLHSLS